MKTTIIKTIALCAVCALTVGCDDYLDTTNERYTPAHDELTSLEALRSTTASMYTQPWYYFHKRRFIQLGDARANNILNDATTSNDWNVQASLNEESENTSLTHAWGSLYNVVTQAGYVIDDYAPYCVKNGVCSQAEANQCIAEARFMRSLAYCFLAMYWHDVPIVTNAVTASETAYANRFEDVLQFAVCDGAYEPAVLPDALLAKYGKDLINKGDPSDVDSMFLRIPNGEVSINEKAEELIAQARDVESMIKMPGEWMAWW